MALQSTLWTRVGHVRDDAGAVEVYVGRGTIWGNPFVPRGRAALSRFTVTESDDPLSDYEAHVRSRPDFDGQAAGTPRARTRLLLHPAWSADAHGALPRPGARPARGRGRWPDPVSAGRTGPRGGGYAARGPASQATLRPSSARWL